MSATAGFESTPRRSSIAPALGLMRVAMAPYHAPRVQWIFYSTAEARPNCAFQPQSRADVRSSTGPQGFKKLVPYAVDSRALLGK